MFEKKQERKLHFWRDSLVLFGKQSWLQIKIPISPNQTCRMGLHKLAPQKTFEKFCVPCYLVLNFKTYPDRIIAVSFTTVSDISPLCYEKSPFWQFGTDDLVPGQKIRRLKSHWRIEKTEWLCTFLITHALIVKQVLWNWPENEGKWILKCNLHLSSWK